jgi:hypothetical protein
MVQFRLRTVICQVIAGFSLTTNLPNFIFSVENRFHSSLLYSQAQEASGSELAPGRQLAAAAGDEYSCEFGSTKFYALCALGGVLSCGITHTAVTPLDLVKCRLQVVH